jgi:lysozyme family protein
VNPQAEKAIVSTILKEGSAYTNNPVDRGGPTKWGVTQVMFSKYYPGRSVETCMYDEAYNVYMKEFWIKPKWDQIDAIDSVLAYRMFDWGVNSGPSRPVQALQRALNVLNQQGKDYPDVTVDGALGPATIGALRSLVGKRGTDGVKVIRGMVQSLQSVFYIELAEKTPSQETFEYGWQLNRAFGGV